MKNHAPVSGLLMGLLMSPLSSAQTTEITKERVIAIHESFIQAMHNRDFSVYEPFLFEGTQVYVDLDPAPDNELQKLALKDFRQLAEMSLQMVEELNIEDELLTIEINASGDQATLISKSTIQMSMLGTEVTEVSRGTTVYGLIDGAIKILSISDEIISTTGY
ncbi:nuclear transport factor 2 family protein [Marinicella sediminis]|uniref:Nuclear transport factor 2 family protein n=1 Tax=Marinicella sediminis TaxID=1792834 RepID=A0ABV7J6R1_9GAMM|nr:nuclear transport factor 2 family protein [Marinicella sediminis]